MGALVLNNGQNELRCAVIDAVNGYRLEAPRVDDEIRPRSDASPAVVSITGDAGLVVHDRITASGEPIEQRGLADVGPTDDDDDRKHGRVTEGR